MNCEALDKYLKPERVAATRVALLNSFSRYLKFMFLRINDKEIMYEGFHDVVCSKLENIAKQKNEKRNLALNVPIGCGKSLLVEYWISWCFARNINNAFVYTSYNNDLIMRLSKETREICGHPDWQLIFGQSLMHDDKSKAQWSFENSANRTGLNARPIGGAITGLDAGNPSVNGFSGALIIDDPVDAVNGARYERTRHECIQYYDDKLATRRRTPDTPTILIMQRIHKEDLSGWVERTESDDWDIVKVPALKEDGTSFWEDRYPVAELEKIRAQNPYKFQAQYQQNPINAGGNVIKGEWFQFYDELPEKLDRVFITADTAQKIKEHNDYSVMCCWATSGSNLYLVDFIRGKWEAYDLQKNAKAFFNKNRMVNGCFCHGMYIEDKASGTGLIQSLQNEGSMPVIGVPRVAGQDKLTRVEDSVSFIYAGQVHLPVAYEYGSNPDIIAECESFQRDNSHSHDDIVDNLTDAIKIGLAGDSVSILDVI